MIDTPRCGEPVEYYELRRKPDKLDVVPRRPDSPCFRPKGHAEREEKAGKRIRHASEQSWRRMLARNVARKAALRARRRENDSAG